MEENIKKILRGSLFGSALCIGASLLLLLIGALITLFLPDHHSYILPIGMVVLYISSLAGGVAASRIGEKPLCALISGLLMLAVSLIGSSFFKGTGSLPVGGMVTAYVMIPASFFLGAVINMLLSSRRPKRRRTRRR